MKCKTKQIMIILLQLCPEESEKFWSKAKLSFRVTVIMLANATKTLHSDLKVAIMVSPSWFLQWMDLTGYRWLFKCYSVLTAFQSFNSPLTFNNIHTCTHTHLFPWHTPQSADKLNSWGKVFLKKQQERWGIILSASHPLPSDLPRGGKH